MINPLSRILRVRFLPARWQASILKRTAPFWHRLHVRAVRLADSAGGAALISILLAPIVAADVVRRLADYRHFQDLRQCLPAACRRTAPSVHYVAMVRTWQESMAAVLLYDRLGEVRWKNRFTISGSWPAPSGGEERRPIILAFLHTGGFSLLRYWLRAEGVAAGSLVRELPILLKHHGRGVRELGDATYGFSSLPHVFYERSLRDAIRFLEPGHVLTIALDGGLPTKDKTACAVNGQILHLKAGAVRLARMTQATLVPVSVHRRGAFRFEIRFGLAVPDALLRPESTQEAMDFLAQELWAGIESDPTGLGWSTLEALNPHAAKPRTAWP